LYRGFALENQPSRGDTDCARRDNTEHKEKAMFDLRLSRSTIMLVVAAIMVLAILLLSSVQIAGAAGKKPAPQKKGEKADMPLDVKGDLKDNDPVDPVHNEPSKTYKVKLKKGRTYVIDMASTDFDSYLRLESPQGTQLAEDDDSGGNLDAQIVYHPEADGEYKVIATRFDGGSGTGAFTLTVHTLLYKTAKAVPLNNGQLKIEGELNNDDPIDLLGPKHRYKVHTVHMTAGRNYTIDMSSGNFDTFLRLMDNQFGKLAEDDDSGGGNNGTDSRIVFTPKADGDYHIIATTFDGQIGNYTLTVREEK
jgi:Bacterial pre-peptidase C-terminal domain